MMKAIVSLLCLGALAGCEDTTPPAVGNFGKSVALTAKQQLGKSLFEDTNLSEPAGLACASCHDPQHAFTGNHASRIPAVALGSLPETFGNRNPPTAMYASFSPHFSLTVEVDERGIVEHLAEGGQFLDGRADTLTAQAKGPFLNPREMNNPDRLTVINKVRVSAYAPLFKAVYGNDALDYPESAFDRVVEAIAAYEESNVFHPFSSKFDDHLRGTAKLEPIEAKGLALFVARNKGNCIACHVGTPGSRNPADWLFTDFTYDNLGIPRNPEIPDNANPAYFDLGLCRQPGIAAHAPVGFDTEQLCGAFKVPTLRNIELTAPYGHNGFFKDLRSVVRFYATRDTNPELWYPPSPAGGFARFNDLPVPYHGNVNTIEPPYNRNAGDRPALDDAEIDAVVAFLKTLTDR